jgi:CBS domain-containing protein
MQPKIRNVMTPEPATVSLQTSLAQAAQLMRDRDTGDVLVGDAGGVLYGIVTDRDIVTRAIADGLDPALTPVQAVITPAPVSVRPDDDASHAVALMREHAIRRLPVVDDNGIAVGIVSLGDLAIDRDAHSVLADISAAVPNN